MESVIEMLLSVSPFFRRFRGLAICGLALALHPAVHAASGTWANNTGDANANWSLSTNWAGGTIAGTAGIATADTGTAVFQASASRENPILDGDRRFGRLSIDNSLGSYNIATSSTNNVLYLQQGGAGGSGQLLITGGGTTTIFARYRSGGSVTGLTTGSTSVTFANGFSISGDSDLYLTNTTPVIFEGSLNSAITGAIKFDGAGSAIINGTIENGQAGTTSLHSNQTFTGTVRINGSNTLSGTTIWRAGTLELGSDTALGVASSNTLQLGTSLSSTPSTVVTTGAYNVSRNIQISSGATNSAITIGGAQTSGTSTFSGAINVQGRLGGMQITSAAGGVVVVSGSLAGSAPTSGIVTKIGAGTVKLTNANGNSYTGGTIVNAGTLLINNTANSGGGTGAVAVNNSATFGGTGGVSGAVNVNAGGTLSPGDTTLAAGSRAGTLSTGALTFNGAGAGFAADINGLNPGDGTGFYDQVVVTGAVNLTTDVVFTLDLNGYIPPTDGTALFTLISNDGSDPVAGSGLFNLSGINLLTQGEIFSIGGVSFQISYTSGGTPATFLGGGNDIALLAVVPEPSALALAGIGAVGLLARRRRR